MSGSTLIIHETSQTLSESDRILIGSARENQKFAYAPYSGFLVGVALQTAGGQIVAGANQENASYPLCMCAERVALYHCAMRHPGETIAAIAITVTGNKPMHTPVPPCGACLQVISEYESRQGDKPIRILMHGETGPVWEAPSVRTMLPHSFDGAYL